MRLSPLLSLVLFVAVAVTSCTQFPTEKSQVVDLRPQISFTLSDANANLGGARVIVNGLDGGTVGSFLNGQSALRVLSGTNRIQVVQGTRTVMDEKVYLGDGVSRSFILN